MKNTTFKPALLYLFLALFTVSFMGCGRPNSESQQPNSQEELAVPDSGPEQHKKEVPITEVEQLGTPDCGKHGAVFSYKFGKWETVSSDLEKKTTTYQVGYQWAGKTCDGENFSKFGNVDFNFTVVPQTGNTVQSVKTERASIESPSEGFEGNAEIKGKDQNVVRNYIYPKEDAGNHVNMGGTLIVVIADDGGDDEALSTNPPQIENIYTTGFARKTGDASGFAEVSASN